MTSAISARSSKTEDDPASSTSGSLVGVGDVALVAGKIPSLKKAAVVVVVVVVIVFSSLWT